MTSNKKKFKEETTTADMAVSDMGLGKVQKKTNPNLVKIQGKPLGENTSEAGAKFMARPDAQEILTACKDLLAPYGIRFGTGNETISKQIAKRNPVYQKEIIKKLDELCLKYNLTLKNLGLAESKELSENFDFAGAENEHNHKQTYNEVMKEEIKTLYEALKEKSPEIDYKLLCTEVAEVMNCSYEQVEEAIGSVTEADEEDDKDESDSSEDKGPKKGVNPFAKKGEKSDEDDSEGKTEEPTEDKAEGDEVDGYVFGYQGDKLVVKGLEHPVAQDLAVAILAKLREAFGEAIEASGLTDLVITIEGTEAKEEKEEPTEDDGNTLE